MSHRLGKRPLMLLVTAAFTISACSGGTSTGAPSTATSQTTAPSAQASTAPTATAVPFTATSYPDAALDCKNLPKGYTGEISQIKAVDAATVEFHLCNPDVAFLSKIAFSAFPINSTAYLAAHSADASIVQKPMGTGPYILKEWVKGDHITLTANPNYWGPDKPAAQTVIVKWSSEAAQRLVELSLGGE